MQIKELLALFETLVTPFFIIIGYCNFILLMLIAISSACIGSILDHVFQFCGCKSGLKSNSDESGNLVDSTASQTRKVKAVFSTFFIHIIYTCIGILRTVVDIISDIVLSLIYRNKDSLPPIDDNNLLESATSLAAKIRTKQVKCVDVIQSYIARIRSVNPLLNALTDDNFAEALKQAKRVDDLIASGAKTEDELETEKPLLGVPFTVKDSVAVKGLRQIVGMVSRKDAIANADAEVVQIMKNAGAINIANTNVPELTMSSETSNKVIGTTKNPYDLRRTCGGSSGGEGSLIAAAGSVIGIGTDVGGSIRIPSCFNGLFGHKPTQGIVSKEGELPKPVGEVKNYNTTGPICRYAEDLLPVFKILAASNVHKLKLDEEVDLKTLRYFYMEDDGGSPFTSKVAPEVKAGFKNINAYLESVHRVKTTKVDIKNLKYSTEIWYTNMASSGAPSISELMTDGQGKLNVLLEFLKWLVFCSNHTLATIVDAAMEKIISRTNTDFYTLATKELAKDVTDLLGPDGIFFYPTQPGPAPYHNQLLLQPFNFGYTGIFNILGLPSTHCPLGLNKDGLPYGVQIVANKYNDHLCLAVAKELENGFGGWVSPTTIL